VAIPIKVFPSSFYDRRGDRSLIEWHFASSPPPASCRTTRRLDRPTALHACTWSEISPVALFGTRAEPYGRTSAIEYRAPCGSSLPAFASRVSARVTETRNREATCVASATAVPCTSPRVESNRPYIAGAGRRGGLDFIGARFSATRSLSC